MLLAACCSFTGASVADSKIRFETEDGVVHHGAYVGGNRARLLAVGVDVASSVGPWALGTETVTIKRLLAPIEKPSAIYAIGLNYWGHINATHIAAPQTPSLFFKNAAAFNDPFSSVVIPTLKAPNGTSWPSRPDYEGELAVVLKPGGCKDVSMDDALSCVQGYTLCHDVSMRCFQSTEGGACPGNGGQFSFSKGLDTHAPIGPSLVSASALGDGSGLTLTTHVNGALRQKVSTSELVYGVKAILSFISQGTTLAGGSVICTGTPDGVGDTMSPKTYLHAGDKVDIAIPQIGTLSNPVSFGAAGDAIAPESLDEYLPIAKIREV